MTLNKAIITLFLFFATLHITSGQDSGDTDNSDKNKYTVFSEFHYLHTTHQQQIPGFSLTVNRTLTPNWLIGVGAEISYHHHIDTHYPDFTIFSFHTIPVYADFKYIFFKKKLVCFADVAPGVTFIQYSRYDFKPATSTYRTQQGFYLYSGVGALYPVFKNVNISAQLGFKGFHISSNPDEINPHGLMYRLGVAVRIP
jgi:hypothetical protein